MTSGTGNSQRRPVARSSIPTYFSHSYRAGDREINLHFHRLFWARGFAFTVDPWSERMAHAQLEHMMKRSSCFVGVATHRPEVPGYRTSPFVVDEYGLAVQAQKPRVVFAEEGVSQRFFEKEHTVVFRRESLPGDKRDGVRQAIDRLRTGGGTDVGNAGRTLGSVGLVLPRTGVYEQARRAIHELLQKAGYDVADLRIDHPNSYQLAMEADRYDFIVIEVAARGIPGWVHPLLTGRFVPMIRLVYERHAREADKVLEPVRGGHAFDLVANKHELVVPWSTVPELVGQLETEVDQLQVPRRQFSSLREGEGYFYSLGRAREGSVFVSNAGKDNELARDLCRHLDLINVPFFQYVYRNTIELGEDWTQRLREKLTSSVLFVPLLTRSYWESDVCRQEWEIAAALAEQGSGPTVYPYFLEDPAVCAGPLANTQGRVLAGMDRDDQIERIVNDVDEYLIRPSPSPTAPDAPWYQGAEPEVDIALIAVLPEEYEAVLRRLERRSSAAGTVQHPNRYSWEFGEIASLGRQRIYRVVLGIAGAPGTAGGLLVVRETIETFHPSYVLLVGIAGGIGKVRKGDVVVSSYIYGYEYGKVDDGFRPRPHWVYHTDTAITTAASTLEIRHPRWYEALKRAPLSPPHVHVGPVASGNKVVDDLTDPAFQPVLAFWPGLIAVEMEGLGAAEAIQDAHERRHPVNFAMVRGISDTPRTARARLRTSQTTQRDSWKPMAADAAAELAVQLVRRAWPHPPRSA